MSLGQLLGPELKALLLDNPKEFQELVDEIHPQDLADVLDDLTVVEASQALTSLPADYAAQVFERLEEEQQGVLASELGRESTARLAAHMDPDDATDFLAALPDEDQKAVLQQMLHDAPEAAAQLQSLGSWDESTAGGLMTPHYLSVRPDMTVKKATKHIRMQAEVAESVDCIYVTDANEKLLGLVTMRRLLLAPANANVNDLMSQSVKSVPPELDQEEVARMLAKYDLGAVPVVDHDERLLGVITADDVLDVIREEQSEDVHKMAAIEPLRDGYLETHFATFLRKRAPWLLILFAGGFLSTQAMQSFEGELSRVTELAFYLPLLISAGGNSGSQSSTLVIRALAVGDVQTSDWWRVLTREGSQGFVLGILLAGLGMLRAMLSGDGPQFAVLVGITIVAIVVLGCVVGALAPIALHRVGIDPATSSTPFIATLVDVLGIVVYLSLARALLGALNVAAPVLGSS